MAGRSKSANGASGSTGGVPGGTTPNWVKVLGAFGILLAVLFVALHLTGRAFGQMHMSMPMHAAQPR